jgi:endonuclease YncB( thermonuclease family)
MSSAAEVVAGVGMKSGKDLSACIRAGRQRRVALNCAGVVTESDGCTIDVTIVDISKDGFRLRSVEELELGSTVSLQMQETRPVRCEIRWACGHEAGGIFLDPITV